MTETMSFALPFTALAPGQCALEAAAIAIVALAAALGALFARRPPDPKLRSGRRVRG